MFSWTINQPSLLVVMYLEAKNLKELLLDVKTRYIICGAQGEMEAPGTPSKNH